MRANLSRILPAWFLVSIATACAAGPMPGDPELTLVAPSQNEIVQGTVEFEVRTRGDFDTDVELFANDEMIYAWTPDTVLRHRVDTTLPETPDGMYRFEVRGTLEDGTELSDFVNLIIDNGGPILELVEPRTTEVFVEDGDFPIVIEVDDVVGVRDVRLFVDEVMIEEWASPARTTLSAIFDPNDAMGSEIFIRIEATDREGRMSEFGRRIGVLEREIYSLFIDDAEFGPALLPDDAIAVGTADRLTIINASGEERCNLPGSNTNAPLLVAPEQSLVYWSTDGAIEVVSTADCTSILSVSLEESASGVATSLARLSDSVASVTFEGQLRIHDIATGAVTAQEDLATLVEGTLEVLGSATFAPDGTLYVAGALGATRGVLFVRSSEGLTARYELSAPVEGGIVADESGVYIPGADGRAYHYGPDGGPLWRTPPTLSAGAKIESTPVLLPEAVVFADGISTVHALALEDGEVLWTHEIDERNVGIQRRGTSTDGARRFVAIGDSLGGVTVLDRDGALHFRSFISLGETTAVAGIPALGADRVLAIDQVGLLVAYQL